MASCRRSTSCSGRCHSLAGPCTTIAHACLSTTKGFFAQSFDDEGARKGYCLKDLGCKGPTTFNACTTVKWNQKTSFPMHSGHGCLGCAQPKFWDREGGSMASSSEQLAQVRPPNASAAKTDGKTRRVVVDPVTRIEGHLRIETDVDEKGVITRASSSGTMVRGIEIILKGRDPRDAWALLSDSAASAR